MGCLVVMLFFVSVFAVPRKEIANRMEIASNSVLTAVALKLLSADQLPDLPYMTFLDKYMLSCIFLLVGLVFFAFVVDTIDRRSDVGDDDCSPRSLLLDCRLDQMDWVLGNVGLVIWCIMNIGLYKPLCKNRSKEQKKAAGGIRERCK